jgi:hypothetical protein
MPINTQSNLVPKTVGPFRIQKMPSIFMARNGKNDIVIHKENSENWGAIYDDKYYRIAMILDAETFHPIRSNLTVPSEVLDKLKAWGF